MELHPDFNDFTTALNKNRVEYIIVGAYALAFLGQPRATGDIDFWIKPTPHNAGRLLKALSDFGFKSVDITKEDILSGKTIQLGYPPVRIDLITTMTRLTPQEIWRSRRPGKFGNHKVFYLGKKAFIKNKRAIGRHKDLADLELLGEL